MALLALLIVTITPLSAQDTTVCEDGFQLIEHELGETCVSDAVERVVALEWTYTEDLLALGIQPVGVADIAGYSNWIDIPVTLDTDVPDVGTRQEPNLEQIAELAPDLILAPSFRVAENYDELNSIAPTITFNAYPEGGASHYDEMVKTFNTIASLVNREAEAVAVLDNLQARYDRVADALDDAELTDSQFVLAQTYISGDAPVFRLFTDNALAIEVMARIGLDNAWNDEPQQYGFTTVDFEGFDSIEDVYFFYIAQAEANDVIINAPVWNVLPFVQSNKQHWLGGDVWLFGGPLSAIKLVETITESLGVDISSETETTAAIECEADFRLFDHEYLAGDPVCIPENPQRILALEISALETVLFTDKELVGTANWLHEEVPVLMPELASALEDIADTGYPANLEVALLTEPDLILAVDGDIDLEAGSEIAPIVMPIAGLDNDWKLSMEFWSEVLGTQDLYADMITNYETRIAEFQDILTNNPEISVVGTSSYGAYLWLEDTAPGVVLVDAGLARPESQALSGEESVAVYDAERWILISKERFDLADGDGVFVFSYATTDPETIATENAAMEEFKANPVWNALTATQAGNVYYVGPYWWRAQTYLLANKVLDDLFTYLTDSSANTPVLTIADNQ